MKKRYYKTMSILMACVCMEVSPVFANRNLYNRVEFGAGNVWTFMGMEAASMMFNQMLHRPVSEATLRFAVPVSEYGNLCSYQGFDDWNYSRFHSEDYEFGNDGAIGFGGRELLSNVIVGDKMGYLSDNLSSVNYCVYGAAYYNLQNLKRMSGDEDYTNICTQRLQLGGGLILTFGSIESNGRVIVDFGLRYDIPIQFSCDGFDGCVGDYMNNGLSSHYMFKYSWENSVAVGCTVDILHYNLFKDENICGNESKLVEFGITLSLLLRSY